MGPIMKRIRGDGFGLIASWFCVEPMSTTRRRKVTRIFKQKWNWNQRIFKNRLCLKSYCRRKCSI